MEKEREEGWEGKLGTPPAANAASGQDTASSAAGSKHSSIPQPVPMLVSHATPGEEAWAGSRGSGV